MTAMHEYECICRPPHSRWSSKLLVLPHFRWYVYSKLSYVYSKLCQTSFVTHSYSDSYIYIYIYIYIYEGHRVHAARQASFLFYIACARGEKDADSDQRDGSALLQYYMQVRIYICMYVNIYIRHTQGMHMHDLCVYVYIFTLTYAYTHRVYSEHACACRLDCKVFSNSYTDVYTCMHT